MTIPIQALVTILISYGAFWTIITILLLYPIILQRKLRSQMQRLQPKEGDPSR